MLNELITNEKLRAQLINLSAFLATTGILLFEQFGLLDTPAYIFMLLSINILSQLSNAPVHSIPANYKLVKTESGDWQLEKQAENYILSWLGITDRQLHLLVNIILIGATSLVFVADYLTAKNQAILLGISSALNTVIYQIYDPNKKIPNGYKLNYSQENQVYYLKKITNV